MSLGRQPPPKPRPGRRPAPPIRWSYASASASLRTSASAASQTSAMALMKEILVARKAFAATLTSSAVAKSVTTKGTPAATGAAYTSRSIASALAERTPATIRSGRTVSATACPSRRNSGLQASSTPAPAGASCAVISAGVAAVPVGVVDFPTIRHGRSRSGASASMQPNSCDRSAPSESARCGVPTQQKCTSPKSAASRYDVVKRSRPDRRPRWSSGSRPGS